jgi:prepilin-type N-terminal cleavage/methylation domain-containing protein
MYRRNNGSRPGLTLIELVVVIVILAILAGLVIPQISTIGRTADMAGDAKNQADIANNISLFFTLQKRFPQYMDSLLESSAGVPTGIYGPEDAGGGVPANGDAQVTGLPVSGPSLYADLTMGVLANAVNAEYKRSFTRCGFDFVLDHDRAVINSNNSGVFVRDVNVGTLNIAEVTAGSPIAQKLFPGTNGAFPANTRLIALGVGPRSSCIPKTMLNSPVYPGCDGKYYGRYVAFFLVYASGERATLVGVSDSYGRNPDYTIQQYHESLPDGARQG